MSERLSEALNAIIMRHAPHGFTGTMRGPREGCRTYALAAEALDELTALRAELAALRAELDAEKAKVARGLALAEEWAGDPVGDDLSRPEAVDDLRAALGERDGEGSA